MPEDFKKQSKLTEKDATGLKYFDKIAVLLQRPHNDAFDRDTAGNLSAIPQPRSKITRRRTKLYISCLFPGQTASQLHSLAQRAR